MSTLIETLQENNDAGWFLLASLDKITGGNEFSDKTEQLQMHVNNLKVSKCALKKIFCPAATKLKLQKKQA